MSDFKLGDVVRVKRAVRKQWCVTHLARGWSGSSPYSEALKDCFESGTVTFVGSYNIVTVRWTSGATREASASLIELVP